MSSRISRRVLLLCLFLVTVLPRLPLIDDAVDVKPDGCEYLGIARHIARERSWVSSIKWHFFTDDPPRHNALADRPPLYPLLAAGIWRLSEPLGDPIFIARLVNVLLAGLDTTLVFLWLELLFTPWAAVGASLIFALYPAWMRDSSQPLTEPLFIALWLVAFLVYYRAPSPRLTTRRAALLGAISGLAFLTRPTGLLLPLFLTVLELGSRLRNEPIPASSAERRAGGAPPHSSGPKALLPLYAAFVLVWLPYGFAVAREHGSPFTSILSYNFSISHIYEGTLYGFERTYTHPWEFVSSRPWEIAELVLSQCWILASALGRSLRFLIPLALLVPRDTLRRRVDLLLFAALNFGFYAVSWTVWGAGRYLLPTYLILAALLIEAAALRVLSAQASRSARDRIVAAFGIACFLGAVAASLAGDLRLHREKARADAGVPLGWAFRAASDELRRESRAGSVVTASNQPWILNLLAERPARMAPRFRDLDQARRYLARYRITHLAYFADEPEDARVVNLLAPKREGERAVAADLADKMKLLRSEDRPAAPHGRATAMVLFRTRG